MLLAERGLSAAEFARMVGVSKGWPANICSGRQKPPGDLEEIAKWALVLQLNGTDVDEFMELALLEHAPSEIRLRYLSMKHELTLKKR